MLTLFDDENQLQGYRLDNFEFYNWGSFHKKIWTLDPQGHSSLLTGSNGSGKTTLVDALVTLLVPTHMRHYNQSSGAEKKRERTEQSYILGAVGNVREENQGLSRTDFLRDKKDYSIIMGNFSNSQMGKKLVLGQIRWFSAGGMQRLFFSCDQALSLQSDILPFESTAPFKKRLQREKNIRFYDNFKQYSIFFIRTFGLRSEKALNLFAQTVGVKVLGDLNSFIRGHMLEKADTKTRFDELYDNYRNLLSSHRQIEKAEKQLELLKPVIKSAGKVKKLHVDIEEKELLRKYLTRGLYPYKRKALDLRKREEADKKIQCENRFEILREDQNRLSESLFQVKQELEGNELTGKVKLLEQEIQSLKETEDHHRKQYDKYEGWARQLEISSAVNLEDFLSNRLKLEDLKIQTHQDLCSGRERISALEFDKRDLDKEIGKLKTEIHSLQGRKNNIPDHRIKIRQRICEDLQIPEEELPYAGELIRVKEEQKQWRNSAEKVLHHFALCLLVPERHYQQVNRYVNEHNLKGRLVYYRTDEREVAQKSDLWQQGLKENSLPQKLEVKPDSPFFGWISNHLGHNFLYTCLDNVDEMSHHKRALTIQGLIKRENRHEKDDRLGKTGPATYVLGWDNREKLRNLTIEYKERKGQSENIQSRLRKERDQADSINERSGFLTGILSIEDYREIDWFRFEQQVCDRKRELDDLLSQSRSLQEMKDKLKTLENEIEEKRKQSDGEQQNIGRINGILQDIEKHSVKLEDSLESSENIPENKVSIDELLDAYLPENKSLAFDAWLASELDIQNILTDQYERLSDKYTSESKNIIRQMNDFLNPKGGILDQFPGWRGETAHLEPREEFISAFESYFKELKADGLPQYRKQFREFLNNRMQEDLIGFQETLDREVRNIRSSIKDLNASLAKLEYDKNPDTYICLLGEDTRDVAIVKFKSDLKHARGDVAKLAVGDEAELENCFHRMETLITELKENEPYRQKVLDVRNWLEFAAEEKYMEDHKQKQFYQDSHSLSGGEKAKLAYTILASAIAYQFGINDGGDRSFRFVMVDEAFSKVDPENSSYAMNLFRNLNLQLMVVTPLDRINLVEDYIQSVHYVDNRDQQSRLHKLSFTEYKEKKKEWEKTTISP